MLGVNTGIQWDPLIISVPEVLVRVSRYFLEMRLSSCLECTWEAYYNYRFPGHIWTELNQKSRCRGRGGGGACIFDKITGDSEAGNCPLFWSFFIGLAACFVDGKAENKKRQVQFSRSVVSDSLRLHKSQHARPPCPSTLPEFTQTHVHQVPDAIQPSHPLSSPSPPAPNRSQHGRLF